MHLSQPKIYNTNLNNFEYVPEDYEENTESTSLAIESESIITESGSVMTDKFDFDIELKLFLFNYTCFDKARELAEAEEREDFDILRENHNNTKTDSGDIVSTSTFDFEPRLDDENDYLVENIIETNTKTRLSQQLQGGHFYEQYGHGYPKFECKHLQKNDTNDGLRILGHWILRMAETSDEVTANSPSLLFIKMALRLGHVNMTNIIDQKLDITSETASDLGKALGIATWNVRNEV
ncbi:11168_t:CDS:2 [Dentiscutata heterogama]|uniref:11168_t:CDS:1 n=1 Tax=Dentiscutata heterogama TaxID=1316150 RepID=A0ACA9LT33_9GLOM|nr:11168_t:CDS:2 [Dentiscutata heterogama]